MTRGKTSILLAMFGTSIETALPDLTSIRRRMQERFPLTSVHLAFTSETIRRVWQERAADPDYRAAHPEVSEDILCVQSPSAMIDLLSGQSTTALVVQPVRIAPSADDMSGKEYLAKSGSAEGSSGGTVQIAVGRPALGAWTDRYDLADDIARVARSLQADIELARRNKAALFYMGHGNKYSTTHSIYAELVREMRRQYPDVLTAMSMVAGKDVFPAIAAQLKDNLVANVILKPFMITAGRHVRKDMVGDSPETLKTQLEKEGMKVYPVAEGLGTNEAFADIFANHAADAAHAAGILLE